MSPYTYSMEPVELVLINLPRLTEISGRSIGGIGSQMGLTIHTSAPLTGRFLQPMIKYWIGLFHNRPGYPTSDTYRTHYENPEFSTSQATAMCPWCSTARTVSTV